MTLKKQSTRTRKSKSGRPSGSPPPADSLRMLETLMSNLPGMVYRCRNDRDWTVEFISDGALTLTGYRPEELTGRGAVSYGRQIIHPDDQEAVWERVQKALELRQPFQLVYRIRTKSGEEKWVWEQGCGVFAADGSLLALEGFVSDMTERKRAEEDLQSGHRLFRLLAEFNVLASHQRVGELAHATLHFIEERLGFQHGTIALLLPDRQGFQIIEARHRDRTGFDKGAFVPLKATVISEVIQGDRPLYRPDLAAERDRYAINRKLLDAGLQSDFLVPLWNQGKCLGTLNVASRHRDGFTEADRDCLTLMAPRLAQAIDQAILFQQLEVSEHRLSRAQQVAHLGNWERLFESDTIRWSDEFFRIFGYVPQAFVPTMDKLAQSIHPDDRRRVKDAIEATLSRGKVYDIRYRIVRPDGSERIVHSQGEATFDGQGRPVRMFGAVQDVTDQTRAEEALRRSEGRLQEAVRASDAGIFDHDHLADTNYWSPKQRAIFGVGPDEVVTLSVFLAAVYPDDLGRIEAAVRKAHDPSGDGRFDVEYRIVRRDGVVRWLSTQSQTFFESIDGARRPVRTVGATIDITERRQAETLLLESEQRFKTLVKNSPDVIMQVARDGTILFINYTLPQYTVEEVTGTNVISYLPRDNGERYLRVLDEVFATGESRSLEVSAVGPTQWLTRVVPLKRDGVVEAAMVIATNITEHKQGEVRLEESVSLLQATLESTADGILVVDLKADGTIASFNNKYLDMWRIPESVITTRDRKQVLAFVQDQLKDSGRYVAKLQQLIAQPDTDSFDIIEFKDGRIFERYSHPQRIAGKSVGRVFSFRDITERKRTEEALRESSQFNQQVITTAREGIIVYDRDLCYLVWNPCMEELTGLRAAQVMGKKPTDLPSMFQQGLGRLEMEQATMERIEASIREAMTGETFAFLDVPFVVRDSGETGWASVRYGPFRNVQGDIVGVIATMWEITERKRAEEQLQQSVSLLQATLESTENGLLVVDAQGKIVRYNRRFLEMWHMPESLLESRDDGKPLAYGTPQLKDPEGFLAKVKALYADPEAESFDILEFKDGRVFERHSKPQRIGERIVGRVWSFHDITPMKLVEQSLTKLSSVVEQAADSILITDRDGIIEYVNPAFELLTGYSSEELLGRSTRLLKSGRHNEQFYQTLWQTILDGRTFQAVFINRKKNGELYYEEKIIAPIKDAAGVITHFVSSGRDITERRRAEEVQGRLAAIIEATTDLVGTVTADGSYLYLNKAGRAMLGFNSAEPVTGLHISACHTQEASAVILNEAIPRAIKHGGWSGESALLSRSGKEIPVSQVILAHKAADGSVDYLSMIARDVSERKAQTAALEYQANHDALTTLPNRNLLNDRLRQAILAAQRDHHSLALLVLDLDRFKEINDTLGHHYGDLLLKEIGPRLRAALRESDTVARLGGDEFAMLLPTADQEGAVMTAQKILQTLARPFALDELPLDVEASIGIALFPEHGLDAETILRRADVAMYMAKQAGSGYALYTSEHDQYSHRRLSLMGELRHAIERQQLFLHYQPTVHLKSGQVIGVEALLRWKHPKYGLVPPDQFIPLAEQTGLIKPLTEMVINAALEQCRAWLRGGAPLSISVNLSARSLHDPTFADYIEKRLLEYGVVPRLLEMEITESAIMADPDRAMEILSSLSIMGVRLAIDDFGVGHSSLAYLKKLPVHEIKIDKSFIINMAEDPDDVMIVRSIIDLGHNQSLKVVAEGVQNQKTLDRLRELSCDAVQGYFVSRPIPADELTQWVNASPWTIAKV
jgi:diguanylate cyclase (GGDEF)-like protein/PAS domain S-box-containing protein